MTPEVVVETWWNAMPASQREATAQELGLGSSLDWTAEWSRLSPVDQRMHLHLAYNRAKAVEEATGVFVVSTQLEQLNHSSRDEV